MGKGETAVLFTLGVRADKITTIGEGSDSAGPGQGGGVATVGQIPFLGKVTGKTD